MEKPGTVSQGELKEGKENLKSKLEELAAIRELKELGLKMVEAQDTRGAYRDC